MEQYVYILMAKKHIDIFDNKNFLGIWVAPKVGLLAWNIVFQDPLLKIHRFDRSYLQMISDYKAYTRILSSWEK